MNISTTKVRAFYWKKYLKLIALTTTVVIVLASFFLYSFSRSVTGEEIEHQAIVISVSVTHSYGPHSQNIRARLNSGKEVYLNSEGTPISNGDNIIVIEKLRKNGANSFYVHKRYN